MFYIGLYRENMVEVHWLMLHTKYQGSRPCGFRQEDFLFYHVCSNYAPGSKNGSAPGVTFYKGLYRENMKKSSLLKPQGIEPRYLV